MPNWFYYDELGTRNGPVPSEDLKYLADTGVVTPETIVETDSGKQAYAKDVRGLFKITEPVTKKHESPLTPPLPAVNSGGAAISYQGFYYDKSGAKTGLLPSEDWKHSADVGAVTPETVVETESGQQANAKNVKGLFNVSDPVTKRIETPLPPLVPEKLPSPIPESSPFTEEKITHYFLNGSIHQIESKEHLQYLIRNEIITSRSMVKTESGANVPATSIPDLFSNNKEGEVKEEVNEKDKKVREVIAEATLSTTILEQNILPRLSAINNGIGTTNTLLQTIILLLVGILICTGITAWAAGTIMYERYNLQQELKKVSTPSRYSSPY